MCVLRARPRLGSKTQARQTSHVARISLGDPFVVLGHARLCCSNKLAINSWDVNTRVYFSYIS